MGIKSFLKGGSLLNPQLEKPCMERQELRFQIAILAAAIREMKADVEGMVRDYPSIQIRLGLLERRLASLADVVAYD